MKAKYQIGQIVKCNTYFGAFESKIIGQGLHRGHRVYDLANEHFVYENQIIKVIK